MVMVGILIAGIAVLFISAIFGVLIHELICVYRNPYPLFHNRDMRLSEIYEDKSRSYKTRSILEDIGYEVH